MNLSWGGVYDKAMQLQHLRKVGQVTPFQKGCTVSELVAMAKHMRW
nr:MAG TPA_asm: hypothetical protein [Caudoviricetes sp.]